MIFWEREVYVNLLAEQKQKEMEAKMRQGAEY
jgi:hypothetical protein